MTIRCGSIPRRIPGAIARRSDGITMGGDHLVLWWAKDADLLKANWIRILKVALTGTD
jgi:hypothetical protein